MPPRLLTIEPLGDGCLVVRLGTTPDELTSRRVAAATARLTAAALPGVVDIAPTFTTVAVVVDPLRSDPRPLHRAILALLDNLDATPATQRMVVEIPVVYGGDDGPDLVTVADHARLTAAEVVRLHTATDHVVGMIGFAPGFPYLLGLPAALSIPRRSSPRTSVPAGSVAIAERQTGIYPRPGPGGWHAIGRTLFPMFDARRDPPALLRTGDIVRFVPVTAPIEAPGNHR